MANQIVDFKQTGADTGEETASAIKPILEGEALSQAVLQRPPENLRIRTEVIKDALEDHMYMNDADRALLLSGGGTVTWGGAFPTYTGFFTITADLTIRPFLAPLTSTRAQLTLGSDPTKSVIVRSINPTGATQPPRAYSGANKISFDMTSVDAGGTGAVTITVDGTPTDNFHVVIDNNAVSGTTCLQLITALNAYSPFVVAGLEAVLGPSAVNGNKMAGSGDDGITRLLTGAADAESHIISAAQLSTFFGIANNALIEGDVLALRYENLVAQSGSGGRRQSLNHAPEATAGLSGNNLFILRLYPERLTHAIPVARVVDGDLVLINNARFKRGVGAEVGGSFVQKTGDTMTGALVVTGTAALAGVTGTGGPTSGTGVAGTGGASAGSGVVGTGGAGGVGVKGIGGSTGHGGDFLGTGAGGYGINVSGSAAGSKAIRANGTTVFEGIHVTSVAGWALLAVGNVTASAAIRVEGAGVKAAIDAVGGGLAITAIGGATYGGISGTGGAGNTFGVFGQGDGQGVGVYGIGGDDHITGGANVQTGSGVYGVSGADGGAGVVGRALALGYAGVYGLADVGSADGVEGEGGPVGGFGVSGLSRGADAGVYGTSAGTGSGVHGVGGASAAGVRGVGGADGDGGYFTGTGASYGLRVVGGTLGSALLTGNLTITGDLALSGAAVVGGDVSIPSANNFKYATASTPRTVHVHPLDFQFEAATGFALVQGDSGTSPWYVKNDTSTAGGNMFARVRIPAGAAITGVQVCGKNLDPVNRSFVVVVERHTYDNDGVGEDYYTASNSSDNAEIVTGVATFDWYNTGGPIAVTVPTDGVVLLRIAFPLTTGLDVLFLAGVRISYTETNLRPAV